MSVKVAMRVMQPGKRTRASEMPTEYWYLFVFAFGAVCAWAVIKGLE